MTDWDHPRPFLRRSRVVDADIDALRHTNNTVYVRWCEEAAWAHSAALGLDVDSFHRLDRAMAVVDGHYRYLQASYLDEEVDTATWIVHWDQRLSMTRHFQVRRVSDGVTLLRARVRFVCVEISSGRPRRLPQEFVDSYGPAIIEVEQQTPGSA